jgi:hypothetical protein
VLGGIYGKFGIWINKMIFKYLRKNRSYDLGLAGQETENEETRLEKAVARELSNARERVEGRIPLVLMMENHLSQAKKCASKLGRDISEEVDAVRHLGYERALDFELRWARDCAQRRGGLTETLLQTAQKYAAYLNRNISEEVSAIREIAKY